MATIVLQAAGAFLGGGFGPVGTAAGAVAGYMIDRSLLQGSRQIEGPRLGSMRPFQAEEGAPLARIYGTVRVGGDMIWATRFEETRTTTTERQGGKGRGPSVTTHTYSYFCNVAFALCEGEIAGVRRIWADGRELDLEQTAVRIYRGTETQAVDPLISAKQGAGNAPAYRGVAYAVFERFPLTDYGNRVPQFQFEVMRPVGELRRQVRSVALLPGATEYGLMPRPVTRTLSPGVTEQVNRNVLHGPCDLVASLDELQMLCPDLEEVAIIASWFGDDLRAGVCTLQPAVMHGDAAGFSEPWRVSGVLRSNARVVSYVEGAAAYGGTPSDRSMIECIAEIKSRGLRVTLHPFVMMDVPPGNSLPNPYGGTGQPPFPWRGRITCHPAPGQPGTTDKTASARAQVEAFCGNAGVGDFSTAGGEVTFSGPGGDWGYRRLILHYAHLAALAGGVHGFLIGSELRGLTTLRDGAGAFPFVEALNQLAGQVRSILGSGPSITYGADWTEYFGHQPPDGTGDVFFHLDPLWSHAAITHVGIDNYMPLSDWRDADYAGGNPDGFREPYDADGLRGQVLAGEGFDWYYADATARAGRDRSPITDGAHSKPWVFRYKDILSWWENQHFNRPGGVEAATPTAWQPRGKPFWFTELGCPAVDKGPNQPNVFPDAKSSEDAIPYFSSGGRSDVAQARFLRAHMEHWNPASPHFEPSSNPVSPVYGGRMVAFGRICLWAWDARTFPAFPALRDLWRDGDNWQRGHWLNGRVSAVTTGDLIAAILADHGLPAADTSRVGGSMTGYLVEAPTTARAALEPLVALYGIAVRDEGGTLVFTDESAADGEPVAVAELVVDTPEPVLERTRMPDGELPDEAELSFNDPFQDYQSSLARIVRPGAEGGGSQSLRFPGCLEDGAATALLADWVQRKRAARESIGFAVPPGKVDVAPGALVSIIGDPGQNDYLVTDVELGLSRRASARRLARAAPTPWLDGRPPRNASAPAIAGAPHVVLLDLPMMPGGAAAQDQFRIAAYADPWRGQVAYSSPADTGFAVTAGVPSAAVMGELVDPLSDGPEGRVHHFGSITVALYGGSLSSVPTLQLLNGANVAAIRSDGGAWEVLQFGEAEEIEPSVWRLSRLLRRQFGTGDAAVSGASAGAPFVLLDEAVVRAGLAPEQVGLTLNWRIGPSGHDFGGTSFVQLTETGGLRARLPLSPVHLRLHRTPGGDATLNWIRRGRIDADNWLAEDIPLGEESERYRVEITPAGGPVVRTVETTAPHWIWVVAQIEADLPAPPVEIEVTVRQISASVGAGLPARRNFIIA